MANDITGRIKLEMQSAARDLEAIDKASVAAGEAVEGIGTKGQVVSRVLGQVADQVEQDLGEAKRAADALSTALGPEMTARIGTEGIDKITTDLRNMGLTADDIEAEVDELANAIKRLDDVGASIDGTRNRLNDVNVAQGRVTDGANMNRSVIANFAGNASQELPGVTNAFGPLNMAISQTVEYAAEGNINITKMVGAGLAMGGVALAIGLVTSELAKNKREQEEARKRVEAWAKEIREGTSDLANLAKEAGEIELSVFGNSTEITDELAAMGLTAEQFFELVKGGQPAIEAWAAEMEALGFKTTGLEAAIAGGNAEQINYNTVLGAAIGATGEYTRAQELAAVQTKVFGEATAETEGGVSALGKTTTEMHQEFDAARREAMGLGDELEDTTDDVDDLTEAFEGLQDTLSNRSSYLSAQEEIENTEAAVAALYEEFAAGTITQAELNRELERTVIADKEAVIDYAGELGDIPPEVETAVHALIDEGKYAEALARLNELERERVVRLRVDSGQVRRNVPIRGGAVVVDGDATGNYNTPGGPRWINDGTVGPEIAVLPDGSKVMTGPNSANYMRQQQAPAPVQITNKTVNQFVNIYGQVDAGNVTSELRRRMRGAL